jgi:hypothetical protein
MKEVQLSYEQIFSANDCTYILTPFIVEIVLGVSPFKWIHSSKIHPQDFYSVL